MMTEIYWKAFLAAIITVILVKLFGCKWGILFLFAASFIGWVMGFILLIAASEGLRDFWNRLKRRP